MRYRCWRRNVGLNAARAFVLAMSTAVAAQSADLENSKLQMVRQWTSATSISLRYLVTDQHYPFVRHENDVKKQLVASPDGKYFFILVGRGDLERDCNEFELQVFDVAKLKTARGALATPLRRVSMCAAWPDPDHAAISQAHWESEGARIVFLGIQGQQYRTVYRLDVESGQLQKLTDGVHDIERYHFSVGGDASVFIEEQVRPAAELMEYPTLAGAGIQQLASIMNGTNQVYGAYVTSPKYGSKLIDTFRPGAPSDAGPWISPDGRYGMFVYAPDALPPPAQWAQYDGIGAIQDDPDSAYSYRHLRIRRFILVDIEQAKGWPIFDAPSGSATQVGMSRNPKTNELERVGTDVLWSFDAKSAVIVSTALPLTEDVEQRRRMAYIIAYTPSNGQWRTIEPFETVAERPAAGNRQPGNRLHHVSKVRWLATGKEFVVEHEFADGSRSTDSIYTYVKGGQWARRAQTRDPSLGAPRQIPGRGDASKGPVILAGGVSAFVQESPDEPFTIRVRNGKQEIPITQRDPRLERVWWARGESIRSKSDSGNEVHATLFLPENAMGKVPLVVQVHRANSSKFWPDGPVTSSYAYAKQPLVGAGMAVLLVEPAADGRELGSNIDALVALLSSRGAIDTARIGLVGVDGYAAQVYYMLTHPPRTKAAAAILSGTRTGTVDEYLTDGAFLDSVTDRPALERLYEGSFWQNSPKWLDEDPLLNVDKLNAPLLLTCQGQQLCRSRFGSIGALRLTGKIFDLMAFLQPSPAPLPAGAERFLYKPRARLASLQTTVDWMAFWLMDHESSDPEKVVTYRRWRQLRASAQATHSGVIH